MQNKFYSYMSLLRLQNPTGYMLVFYPTLFGLLLSAESYQELSILPLFFVASVLSRGAGCIINDITDRKLDKYVTRTKDRPLASGRLSTMQAIKFLFLILFVCLCILLFLSVTSIMVGFIAFLLILIYPFMKRITHFPQIFLGSTFNLGLLISFASKVDLISEEAFMLYVACCFWTIGYDTIYAFMDLKDDKKIGIKSTAVYFEDKAYRFWISIFYMVFILIFCNINSSIGNNISVITAILFVPVIIIVVKSLDIYDIDNCEKRFRWNSILGLVFSISMTIDFIVNKVS